MPVVTLGLNHKTAPLEVREQVVFPAERLDEALAVLSARPGVREAAVLSTCNRTEIYAVLAPEAAPGILQRWLEGEHRLAPEWLSPYLYVHSGRMAVAHLLSVAAGLDSLVLGEPQILGQAKLAYHSANRNGLLGRTLERLFQHAFAVAKQVRTDTDIGAHPVSVAFAAVTLARQIFGDMDRRTALLIGAGETVELTARHLREQGLRHLLVANRSLERARRVAEEYDGEALELGDIPRRLAETDIVVASTGSTLPILGKGSVERALRQRKHRPMFMVDVAVPRDIEPEVGELADVYLYTIDDLRGVIDDSLRSREAAARQAETIVETQTERFMDWLRTLDAVGAIQRYRQQADRERERALQRARRQLAAGRDPERVLEELSHRLTRKLLHAPTVGLREAARSGDPQTIRISHRTLGVEDDSEGSGNGTDR